MQIAYVDVFVSDLLKSVDYFKDKLGLEPQFAAPEH